MSSPGVMSRVVNNILIVGMGYLGSALARYLRSCGYVVYGADVCLAEGVEFVDVADFASVGALASQLPCVPDWVIFCVSTKGGDLAHRKSLYLDGTEHLLRVFINSRVCLCSSTAVYGGGDGRWCTEEAELHPSALHIPLCEAERRVCESGGMVLRLGALYGPGRCVLVEKFLSGIALSGDWGRWCNYIHRDDAVSAVAFLFQQKECGGIWNLTDMAPMRLCDIYEGLSSLLDKPMPSAQSTSGTGARAKSNHRISCQKLCQLGWIPRYENFLVGVQRGV